jgi:crotonobetainyl-CoA:carnitine CoA-transferase CaiB-like acyl-CoA transferase
VLAMMESVVTEYYKTGYVRERSGSRLPGIAPSNVYPTRDGEILIGANQDTVYRRLTEVMGRPELADDPKFADHVSRGKNEIELDNLISAWTREFDAETLLEKLHAAGIPAGKIFTAKDMLENEHFKAREALVSHHHPGVGELMMQNVVPKLSGTPGSIRRPAPDLGAHNREVYGGLLGLDEGSLARLKEAKII